MIFMIQKEMALKFDYKLPKMNKYKFLTKIVSNYTNVLMFHLRFFSQTKGKIYNCKI